MSCFLSVHCDGSRFATPVGSWCLVKLLSCRQCLHLLFLSPRMRLSVCFLYSTSQKKCPTAFFLYSHSLHFSLLKLAWNKYSFDSKRRTSVCMCLFEGHRNNQPTCFSAQVHCAASFLRNERRKKSPQNSPVKEKKRYRGEHRGKGGEWERKSWKGIRNRTLAFQKSILS